MLLADLGDGRIAVVAKPIDEWAYRGIFLILEDRGVVKRAQQIATALQLPKQSLVVDVEADRLGGGVKIGTIDEYGNLVVRIQRQFIQSLSAMDAIGDLQCQMPDRLRETDKRQGRSN